MSHAPVHPASQHASQPSLQPEHQSSRPNVSDHCPNETRVRPSFVQHWVVGALGVPNTYHAHTNILHTHTVAWMDPSLISQPSNWLLVQRTRVSEHPSFGNPSRNVQLMNHSRKLLNDPTPCSPSIFVNCWVPRAPALTVPTSSTLQAVLLPWLRGKTPWTAVRSRCERCRSPQRRSLRL